MLNVSNTLVILLWTVGQCEGIMVKVCLYPGISWGKPTFAEFRITSIVAQLMPAVYRSESDKAILNEYVSKIRNVDYI